MDIEKKKEIILSVLKEEGHGYKMPNNFILEKITDAVDKKDRATAVSLINRLEREEIDLHTATKSLFTSLYGIAPKISPSINQIDGVRCYRLIIDKIAEEENRENELAKKAAELTEQKEQKKREYASQLELVEKYKDTLMFLESVQEKIRKEREQFYNEKIKLVTVNLKETGLDPVITQKWIEDLVSNYSKSLDISNEIFAEATDALKNEFLEKSKEIELTKKL